MSLRVFEPYEQVGQLQGHKGAVLNARFSHEGGYCMTCGQDKTVRLWNPHKFLLIKSYDGGHNHEIADLSILSDNRSFISVGGDKQGFQWDVSTGAITRRFGGHDGLLHCCALSENDHIFATGGFDKKIRFWDLRAKHSRQAMQTIDDARDAVTSLIMRQENLYASSVDGSVYRYDIRKGRVWKDCVRKPIGGMSLSSDADCIIVSCLDNSLRLIETPNGSILNTYRGHQNENFKLSPAFTPCDSFILCGSEDGRLCCWDLLESAIHFSDKAHIGSVFSVRYHAQRNLMITTSDDATAKIYKQKSPNNLQNDE